MKKIIGKIITITFMTIALPIVLPFATVYGYVKEVIKVIRK